MKPGTGVVPACLPGPRLPHLTRAVVTGRGRLGRPETAPHSDTLQAVEVPVLSSQQCAVQPGATQPGPDQLCAGLSNTGYRKFYNNTPDNLPADRRRVRATAGAGWWHGTGAAAGRCWGWCRPARLSAGSPPSSTTISPTPSTGSGRSSGRRRRRSDLDFRMWTVQFKIKYTFIIILLYEVIYEYMFISCF